MKIEDLNTEDRAFVDSIHANCTRSGDCLMWDGKTTNSGYPKAHIDGKYRMVRPRATRRRTSTASTAWFAVRCWRRRSAGR